MITVSMATDIASGFSIGFDIFLAPLNSNRIIRSKFHNKIGLLKIYDHLRQIDEKKFMQCCGISVATRTKSKSN